MTDPVVVSTGDLASLLAYVERQYQPPALAEVFDRLRAAKPAVRVDIGETGLGSGMVANPNGRYVRVDA